MIRWHETPVQVTRSSLPPLPQYTELLSEIWESAWLTNMGPLHERFKEELKAYLRAEELELFVNGHTALEMAIAAFGLSGEVITTPFSFSSTTHAIVRNGLTPVFCDIRPDDCTLDAEKIEEKITDRTCAIVPVHVYGNLCDTEAIGAVAARHGLKVIYDAAHAFGTERDGVSAAAFGDASMFSFHATKVFNSIEGGAVSFRDPALKERLYRLKNFGITGYETVDAVGANGKMNEFQAAMGILNLRYLGEEIKKREVLTLRYRAHLSGVPGIRLCPRRAGDVSNYAYMPVFFDGFAANRDQVFARLKSYNIHPRKYFYPCIHEYACYREAFGAADVPAAKKAASQVLTLPLYADLEPETVDEICEIILTCRPQQQYRKSDYG